MNWTDEAIILSARKFGERDLIVNVFAEHEGIYGGVVRGGQGKKNNSTFQQGNLVEANWKARLSEHMGTITAEVISANAAHVLQDRVRLQVLLSACSVMSHALAEREKDTELYHKFKQLIERLKAHEDFIYDYILFEIELLKHIGFGLDLVVCAVTGKAENLAYVSPRTGRAVSTYGAQGYESKLLKLPKFLTNNRAECASEVAHGLALTEYFLQKNLFYPHNKKMPESRQRLADLLSMTQAKAA